MTNITIPKGTTTNQDLVAVPKSIYKDFLNWQRKVKSVKTYNPTDIERREIVQARKEAAEGKTTTLEELENELNLNNS